MKNYIPKTKDIKILAEAVRETYLAFDREDWCINFNLERGGCSIEDICQDGQIKCNGCICYDNLKKAYKIAKNIIGE